MELARKLAVLLGLISSFPIAGAGRYDAGASDREIRIGNTNPYSGPASAYGTIGRALAAYFQKVNDEGGINGRRITFISYDDGFNPAKTFETVRRLVEHDKVLLIFQTLGTAPNSAIRQYLNDRGIPQLFIASGATKWNDPQRFPWTMGFQPSYQTEAVAYAQHLLRTVGEPRIGILYQRDDYGRDYLNAFKRALGSKGNLIVSEHSYGISDPTVDSQVIQMHYAGVNVLLNITSPKFAAQVIRKLHELNWHPVHYLNTVSASVDAVLRKAGLERAEGIYSAQYLKDPSDPQFRDDPAILEWRQFMRTYYRDGSESDILNVYAYTAARLMIHTLQKAGNVLTRDNVRAQAANLNVRIDTMLPGLTVRTSPSQYAPIDTVRLQRFDGRTWALFGDHISGRR